MVKGENTLEAGTPAGFDVLTNEIRGLGLNRQLEEEAGVKKCSTPAGEMSRDGLLRSIPGASRCGTCQDELKGRR